MRRGAGQIEPGVRRLGSAGAGHGSKDRLLVHGRGPAVDGALDQVGVLVLQIDGTLDDPGRDGGPEAGRDPLDGGLDPLALLAHGGPAQRQVPGQVGVPPRRLGPSRRPGGVGHGHLPEQDQRPLRRLAFGEVGGDVDEPVQPHAEVHGAGAGRRGVAQGTGDERAQLSFRVGQSSWKRQRCRSRRAGSLGSDEVAVERGRRDVGQHGATRPDPLAVAGAYAHGPATRSRSPHAALVGLAPAPAREPARRPAAAHRPAAQGSPRPGRASPATSRTPRCPRRPARGRCAARCRSAAAPPRLREVLVGQPAHGKVAKRARSSAPAVPRRRSRGSSDRTGGNGVKSASSNGSRTRCHCSNIAAQAAPSPARRRPATRRCGPGPGQHRAAAVVEGVGQHVRRVDPPQAVPVQIEVPDHRRRRREG